MNRTGSQTGGRGFTALRRFTAKTPETERCDLCAVAIPERHQHLAEPNDRRLYCACDACAILFNDSGQTKYKRVPRDSYILDGFEVEDQLWSALGIPAGLVFFFFSSPSGRIMAFYPSPAGSAEAEIDSELWDEMVRDCTRLQNLTPDVEALLVNRMNGVRDYFLAPIDECYVLTGLIRKHWRGFSGGDDAWQALNEFFDGLRKRSRSLAAAAHAGR
jgi:hypothetical protein